MGENVRFTWNNTPSTRLHQTRSSFHPAFHYTPFAPLSHQPLHYNPFTCKCEAVFNQFCPINFHNRTITCCICATTTLLPYPQQTLNPHQLPIQLIPGNNTFEYTTVTQTSHCNAYVFVVDLCIGEKQMICIKQQMMKLVGELDEECRVGLITFDRSTYVHQINDSFKTIYQFNGSREYTTQQTMHILGIDITNHPSDISTTIHHNFILTLKQARSALIRSIRSMHPTTNQQLHRWERATGAALNIAICMSRSSNVHPRVLLIAGGPCTVGPGMVISTDFTHQMRSIGQISRQQNNKYYDSSKMYYEALAKKALGKKIIIDCFMFSYEEVGLMEMSYLINSTGGYIIMHEDFQSNIFAQSLRKLFSQHFPSSDLQLATSAILIVYSSTEVVINGALGQCHPLNSNKPNISNKQIGYGNTNTWYLGSLDRNKTITILYESRQNQPTSQDYYIQIKTIYKTFQGVYNTRVTTVHKKWTNSIQQMVNGFDQEAAAVYLFRMVAYKGLREQINLREYVDKILCRWAAYFALYRKNDVNSFRLPDKMKHIPQYAYHLRRSYFISKFGCSLDQLCYRSHLINRQSIQNCLLMIQPALLKYSLQAVQPQAVQLDEEQMKDEVILVLDCYLNIVEWYGSHIQSWYESKHHENQQYPNIVELLKSPKQDIQFIISNRFPIPNYYLVYPSHSKERFLKSRISHRKEGEQRMVSDECSIKQFMKQLVCVVVNGNLV